MRICGKCGKERPPKGKCLNCNSIYRKAYYAKNKQKEGGRQKAYQLTLRGFLQIRRRSQLSRRYVEYDLDWLVSWAVNNTRFMSLFTKWVGNPSNKRDMPVIDRINPSKPYLKSNIQCLTFKENLVKARVDRIKYPNKNNTSGRTGVRFIGSATRNKHWVADIRTNNKVKSLGYFFEFEDAVKAREAAELKYWGVRKTG